MSIYGRRKGILDFDRVEAAEPSPGASGTTNDNGRAGTSETPLPPQVESDVASMRKATPASYLLPSTLKWLRALPADVAPAALAVEFPRILNVIAHQWSDRHACPSYFSDLLVDRRGGRRGFPEAVYAEIRELRGYWYTLEASHKMKARHPSQR